MIAAWQPALSVLLLPPVYPLHLVIMMLDREVQCMEEHCMRILLAVTSHAHSRCSVASFSLPK